MDHVVLYGDLLWRDSELPFNTHELVSRSTVLHSLGLQDLAAFGGSCDMATVAVCTLLDEVSI